MLIRSNLNTTPHTFFTLVINLLAGLFFITVLIIKKGYSYTPLILSGISIIYFFIYTFKLKKKWKLDKDDKWLIFSFIFYFFTFFLSIIVNNDSLRVIDNPSRILLFIPVLFLFSIYKIKVKTILYSISLGAITTGIVALFQKFYLGYIKPFPEVMHIQAGNIAISLSTFSLVLTIYFFIKKEYRSALLGTLGIIFATISSALSGARGGWIGLPIVLISIFFLYRQYISKKLILSLITVIVVSIMTLISNPKFGIKKRYSEAKSDIILYLEKNNKNTSLGARFDMWGNALIAIKQAPLFGHGDKGYESFKEQQVESKQMEKNTLQFNSLHNQYLESWVKRGFIGFIGLMLVTLMPLFYFIRNLKEPSLDIKCIAILGITHILSHLFYFMSQSFLAHNSGSIFYFFVLVLIYALVKKR
ncbi:Lipid A core - O-antigen ligase and related enzymes [Stutzerimonas stutzeri]|nr:Lipid A core - O-antigen ligase and related enzymes [Stutzerimonas stutzeri]